MKKLYFAFLLFLVQATQPFAQTATDFTSTTCAGNAFHLFDELNSGKVIVLCWVMPCSACIGPSLTTMNVVQSYSTTYPNTVHMYIVDDYANTTCPVLDNWKNNSGLSSLESFSDPTINMMDYGSQGMPKVVVIAGGTHTVFYNANDVVNATDLQSAINQALQVIGINEANDWAQQLQLSPNPSSGETELVFTTNDNLTIGITLFSLQGKEIKTIFSGKLNAGNHRLAFNTEDLAEATYLLQLHNGSESRYINLVVKR